MIKEGLQTAFEVAKYAGFLNLPEPLQNEVEIFSSKTKGKALTFKQKINLTTNAISLKAKESILLDIPVDYPPDFDNEIIQLFDGNPLLYPIILGSHKAHPEAFGPLSVAQKIAKLNKKPHNGSLLLVAANIDGGQNPQITDSYHAVRPILNQLTTETIGVLRKKDMKKMKREDKLKHLRLQKDAIKEAISRNLTLVSLPEGSVESGRQKKGGIPGEINGMIPLEENSVMYLVNLVKEAGYDPLLIFVGDTGGNRIYNPIYEKVTKEAKVKGAIRALPGGRRLIKSILTSVADYPTTYEDVVTNFGCDGRLPPGFIEQYVGERLAQLIPPNERGVYNNPQLLEQAPEIKRRDTATLFKNYT